MEAMETTISTVVLGLISAMADRELIRTPVVAKYGGPFLKAQIGCVPGFDLGTQFQTSEGSNMKKTIKSRYIVLTLLSIVLLIVLVIFALPKESVNAKSVDAMLTVQIRIMPKQSDNGDIELCFSRPPCVKLEKVGRDLYEFPWLLSRDFGDTPFVEYSDDWDHLYLSRGPGLTTIRSIYIRYDVSYTLSNVFSSEKSFVFVDWSAPDGKRGFRLLTGNQDIDLSADIEFNRRKQVVEAMGETDLSPANVNAIFVSLPEIVKSGVHDIGQAGISKFKGSEHPTQNGCDEFYCWHYVETNLNDAYDVLDNCCSGADCNVAPPSCCPGDCPDNSACWTTRCFKYKKDAYPSPYICHKGAFPPWGWKQNNRLAKVIFKYDTNGNRFGIDTINRINPTFNIGDDDYDDWVITSEEYQPKIGDMLARIDLCPLFVPGASNSSHVMMLLSDMTAEDERYFDKCLWGNNCLNARVLEKGPLVEARIRSIATNFNEKCKDGNGNIYLTPAGNPIFRWELYIGELK